MSAAGGDESVEEYEEVDALDDSDDDFAYEEVDIEDIEDDDLLAGDDEDLRNRDAVAAGAGRAFGWGEYHDETRTQRRGGHQETRGACGSPGRTSTTRLFPIWTARMSHFLARTPESALERALNAVTAPNGLELRGRGHASVRTRRTRPMSRALTPHPPPVPQSKRVMDDFVRNFMVRMGLTGTLEKFETEWYEMEATGKLNKEDMGAVPDVYNYNQELNDQCVALRREVNAQKAVVEKATSTWEKFRKERDVHRMHHKRIGQEKNKLLGDIKKLRKHYAQYEPTIKELKRKYELAMRGEDAGAHRARPGFSPSRGDRGGAGEEGQGGGEEGEGQEGCRGKGGGGRRPGGRRRRRRWTPPGPRQRRPPSDRARRSVSKRARALGAHAVPRRAFPAGIGRRAQAGAPEDEARARPEPPRAPSPWRTSS